MITNGYFTLKWTTKKYKNSGFKLATLSYYTIDKRNLFIIIQKMIFILSIKDGKENKKG